LSANPVGQLGVWFVVFVRFWISLPWTTRFDSSPMAMQNFMDFFCTSWSSSSSEISKSSIISPGSTEFRPTLPLFLGDILPGLIWNEVLAFLAKPWRLNCDFIAFSLFGSRIDVWFLRPYSYVALAMSKTCILGPGLPLAVFSSKLLTSLFEISEIRLFLSLLD
jgi:hypothetical protein